MDTIGLLGAWIAVITLFVVALSTALATFGTFLRDRWVTSRQRKNGSESLSHPGSDAAAAADVAHLAGLVYLFGQLTAYLIGAIGLVLVSLVILDLGPALLASTLPFNINSKLLIRTTGLLTVVLTCLFVGRICYLAVLIRSRRPLLFQRRIANLTGQLPTSR